MNNQTLQNSDNNGDEKQKNEAEFMLRSLWLGIRPSVGTPCLTTLYC